MTVQELENILSEVKDKNTPVIFSTFSMHQVEDIEVKFCPKDIDDRKKSAWWTKWYDKDYVVIAAQGI